MCTKFVGTWKVAQGMFVKDGMVYGASNGDLEGCFNFEQGKEVMWKTCVIWARSPQDMKSWAR